MKNLPVLIPVVAALSLLMHTSAPAATVRMIDQSTVRGDLVSVDANKLILRPQPTTQPTTRMAVDMADIAQVVFRESPVSAEKPPEQEEQHGILNALGSIFSGSPPPDSDAPPATPDAAVPPPTAVTASPAASQPAISIRCLMTLKSGDVLQGHITQWYEQTITMDPDAAAGQKLEIPGNQLIDLWCGSDELVKKAAAMKVDPGPQDVVFVEKDNKVVTVKGVATGVAGDALQFRLGDDTRKISLARLVGIVFANAGTAAQTESSHQAARLSSGDVMTGAWTGVNKKVVTLRTTWGVPIQIPLANIDSIDFLGGRLTYLSDLKPARVEQTPFFGRVIPFRLDRSLEGGTLKLSDGIYAKGIAVHSRCILQYNIGGNFARFQTKLGFEDPQGKRGSVSARVLGDARVLYENPEARGDQKPVQIDVDVSGLQTLTLEVDFGREQDVDDRVIWANALLLRSKASQ